MAQKTVLVDDIDGDVAEETVSFALDGVSYEIDLNQSNAAQLRDDLAHWIGNARSERRKVVRGGGVKRTRDAGENANIRNWAREQGLQVSERGRISAEVVEAYYAAN